MDDSIPEYYRPLADETGEESGPEQQADPEGNSRDEETDSQNTL